MGATHDASPAAKAAARFCIANNLADPREEWDKNLIHPREMEK